MNENNVNPKPLDSDEGENVEPLTNGSDAMSEDIQTEQSDVAETSEIEQNPEATETQETEESIAEENNAESLEDAEVVEDTEAEESEATEEVSQEPVKKKKKGRGAKAVITILVLIMVVAIAGMVSVIYMAQKAKIDLEQIALSVEDVDSNAAEFYQSYMYYYSYNSYYQYSDEELKELAIDQLLLTNALYSDAIENGYTVTDEIQAQIDEQISSVTVTAEASSMTADEYLNEAFCPGFTVDMFKEILEKSIIAQTYYADKIEAIEKQYEGDSGKAKIEAEYAENKLDYDLTDVSYWYFASSEENAQANADSIIAQVNGGKSFVTAIQNVTGDSEAIPNNLKGHSKSTLENGSFVKDAIEWIFAENEDGSYKNGTGAITSIADDSKIYVFYVNNAPQRDEIYPVDVCYIQVDVSEDASIKTEKELKIEAKSTADAILKEFEETDKTIESFTNLISKHNNGDNDLVSGDIFELMKNDGSQDLSVEEWAFEENRKVGDYALVESDDCYYIVFFANKAENAVWYDTILSSLITNEARNFEETILTESKENAQINDEVINEVVAYVANLVASQYGY